MQEIIKKHDRDIRFAKTSTCATLERKKCTKHDPHFRHSVKDTFFFVIIDNEFFVRISPRI